MTMGPARHGAACAILARRLRSALTTTGTATATTTTAAPGLGAPGALIPQQQAIPQFLAGQNPARPYSSTSVLDRYADRLPGGLVWSETVALRRAALCRSLAPGSVVLVPAAKPCHVPGTGIPLPFRQEATFFYLTGVYDDSDMIAALEVSADGASVNYKLFVGEDDAERTRWEGERYGKKDVKTLRADCIDTLKELPAYVRGVRQQNRSVVVDAKMWRDHPFATEVLGSGEPAVSHLKQPPMGKSATFDALEQVVHELRWRKSDVELDLMRASSEITTLGFDQCMRLSHPSMNERQISALFEFVCKQEGAQHMPYPQVVAGGNSACTIHYSRNNRKVFDGEMVLMDAGCDFFGYASDVTRTWPVSGRFTEPQREVYERVLEAHEACLEMCREGNTLRDVHKVSVHLLSKALSRLGIIQKSTQAVLMQGLYKPFYPHSIGHWLGMDTHDVHTISALRPFEAGTVLTIEPGLYLPRNVPDIPAQYRGIGIRLEDDVVVRENGMGPEVLSCKVPITVRDVETTVGHWMDAINTGQGSGEGGQDFAKTKRKMGNLGVYYNHPGNTIQFSSSTSE